MKSHLHHINERDPTWHPHQRVPYGRVPRQLLRWLLDPASLTLRLQCACRGVFHVQVVSQSWARPMRNEAARLGIRQGQYALIRQVRLMCDDQVWVFARTVIPRSTLTGKQQRLASLGSRPLGAMLFADPGMRRGEMELACIRRGQGLFQTAIQGVDGRPAELWGRRSVFYLSGKSLLVSEVFIPGIVPCSRRLWSDFMR